MRTHVVTALSGAMLVALATSAAPAGAVSHEGGSAKETVTRKDDLPHPLGEKQREMRTEAVRQLIEGDARLVTKGTSQSIEMRGAHGRVRYVEYPVSRTDRIFTILSEFGEQTMPAQGGTPGPLHNQIPAPDRTKDNSTYWRANFDRAHYTELMFGGGTDTFKDFYRRQSSGRLSVEGDVSDWVKLPYNEARYGHNPVPGDGTSEAEQNWAFVKDSGNAWYEQQKAAGKSREEIVAYLKTFDVYDRYDHDADGNFNEPDGYIDNFQTVHAGEDESGGGGAQGTDAIWAHRWYAFSNGAGSSGPQGNLLGGTQIGDTGIWIGDYTVQGENGGLGVFVHEYAHNLGLPDFYDTAGGDNGTGFWSLMSSGSWLNRGKEAIGDSAGFMGPWEKLQMNWLDHKVVDPATGPKAVKLGPAYSATTNGPQAVIVPLKPQVVTDSYNTPHSGTKEWWSGNASGSNSTLTQTLDLTKATSASVSAWWELRTEQDYDYAYAEVSTDGGATWTQLLKRSGISQGWEQVTLDLTPYAGKSVQVRFRYQSDGGVNEGGLFVDDLTTTVDGKATTDDVETETATWVPKGFTRMSGSVTREVSHYYMAENRRYGSYDANLRTGPYNFGSKERPDWVERYPYQDGLLVWYVNNAYTDNNTKTHPGGGLALPVDSHPAPITTPAGTKARNRVQSYDATFGLQPVQGLSLHQADVAWKVPAKLPVPIFSDKNPEAYWDATNPWNSVKVAGSGTKIHVLSQGETMNLLITRK